MSENRVLPNTIDLVSPDWVGEIWAPQGYNHLLCHKKYWVSFEDRNGTRESRQASNIPWDEKFEQQMRRELIRGLERIVKPDDVNPPRDLRDLSPQDKWICHWFNFPYKGTEVEWGLYCHPDALMSKAEAFRMMLKGQLEPPHIFVRRSELKERVSVAERKARGLLREMIGDEAYREYLRRGFLVVEGRSGLLYHIWGGHHRMMEVRHPSNPKRVIERICVVFKNSNLPHTDSVIMRLLLVRHDEFGMRTVANVFRIAETASA